MRDCVKIFPKLLLLEGKWRGTGVCQKYRCFMKTCKIHQLTCKKPLFFNILHLRFLALDNRITMSYICGKKIMSQSLSTIYVHAVWHIKRSSVPILPDIDDELYGYLGASLRGMDCLPVIINGVENHVHILFVLSKNHSIAEVIHDVKINSSKWIKTKGPYYKNFAWQTGYGAFSVSERAKKTVMRYIQNQKEHHRKKSFEAEYINMLNSYHVEYKEEFIFTD